MVDVTITLKHGTTIHYPSVEYVIYPNHIVIRQYNEDNKLVNTIKYNMNDIKTFSFTIN